MNFLEIFAVLARGAGYTIGVTVAGISAALAIGLAAAFLSRLPWKPVKAMLAAYTYVFRSVPLLVLLFHCFSALHRCPFTPFASMVLCLGLVSGAYRRRYFGAPWPRSIPMNRGCGRHGDEPAAFFRHIILPQMFRMWCRMINEFHPFSNTPFCLYGGNSRDNEGNHEPGRRRCAAGNLSCRGIYFVIYRLFVMLFMAIEAFMIPGISWPRIESERP